MKTKIKSSQKNNWGIDIAINTACCIKIFLSVSELQVNLIRSHASGVGPPLNQMRTRMLLALRINVLAKGYR